MTQIPIIFLSIDDLIKKYKNNESINYSNLGLTLGRKVILAQILYTKNKVKTTYSYQLFADIGTYEKKRYRILEYILTEIVIKKHQLGQSNVTIYTNISYITNFINWLNNNHIDYIATLNDAREVFLQYTYELKSKIRKNVLAQSSAHAYHYSSIKLLQYLFHDKNNYIALGVNMIENIRDTKVERSEISKQKYHFDFYFKLFHAVTDFLLQKKDYPFQLHLPGGMIWVLPSPKVFIKNISQAPTSFNFNTGRLKDINTIMEENTYTQVQAQSVLKTYTKNLQKHNNNYTTEKRMNLGRLALKAYHILFLSITGMNASTATTLPYKKNYTINKNSQKFRTIKYRAGNKIVEFQLQHRFINDFKKFLLLREYLLQGFEFKYLFFAGYEKNAQMPQRYMNGSFCREINASMKKNLDNNLPNITSRTLRVNKTSQVIKEHGIIAASQLAQSSINTIISSYQGSSVEMSKQELNAYYESLNETIFNTDTNNTETSIGHCKKIDEPTTHIKFNQKDINCSIQEGCLFCENYAIHVDTEDLNKLYSLKYLIHESRYIAKDLTHFNDVYTDTLKRIEDIANQCVKLKKISKNTLQKIRDDVFVNENLHPYWEQKLRTLIDMGVMK